MSKVMWPLFDWSRKLASPSRPIICKTEPITIWLPTFSRAVGSLVGFTLSSHWLLKILSSILIGFVITLIFVFWHLIEKCSMYVCVYLFYSLTMLWQFFASVSFNIELFRCEITKQPKTTLVFINLELQNWLKILDKCWLDYWIFLYSGLVIEH